MLFQLPDRRVRLIGGGQFIAPTASIIGAVTLHRDVGIWFGAVLRADDGPITVGEGTNIQDGVIVHVDRGLEVRIGENVTIGHGAILHGCVVEQGVLVGMRTTVLNGARIGHHALIGANSLVIEGMEIPPGVLAFGSPARVMRVCTDAEIAAIQAGARDYRARCGAYLKGLARQAAFGDAAS